MGKKTVRVIPSDAPIEDVCGGQSAAAECGLHDALANGRCGSREEHIQAIPVGEKTSAKKQLCTTQTGQCLGVN